MNQIIDIPITAGILDTGSGQPHLGQDSALALICFLHSRHFIKPMANFEFRKILKVTILGKQFPKEKKGDTFMGVIAILGFFWGRSQWGQAQALWLIFFPHSLHSINAISGLPNNTGKNNFC